MSTSKLQRRVSELLSIHLGQYTIRENTRPDWLITSKGARLELDFYIEELQIAIEVQGAQHYIFVPHFHKHYSNFQQRIVWDNFKRNQCNIRGIRLIEIDNEQDAILAIRKTTEATQEQIPQKIDRSEFYVVNVKNVKQHKEQEPPSFAYYDKTIRKNLRRLYGILKSYNSFSSIPDKKRRRINTYLQAIEQYKKAKEIEISFDEYTNSILEIARSAFYFAPKGYSN